MLITTNVKRWLFFFFARRILVYFNYTLQLLAKESRHLFHSSNYFSLLQQTTVDCDQTIGDQSTEGIKRSLDSFWKWIFAKSINLSPTGCAVCVRIKSKVLAQILNLIQAWTLTGSFQYLKTNSCTGLTCGLFRWSVKTCFQHRSISLQHRPDFTVPDGQWPSPQHDATATMFYCKYGLMWSQCLGLIW